MPAKLDGLDRYSGSRKTVAISREGAYVIHSIDNEEVLLTPDQARAVGDGLIQQARYAENASELTGELDT